MFQSILYPPETPVPPVPAAPPACFADIGLGPVLDRLRPYCPNLSPWYLPAPDEETIRWRQEIGRDLEQLPIRRCFGTLCRDLTALGRQLPRGERDLPRLDACRLAGLADRYISQLQTFLDRLPFRQLRSRGLRALALHVRSCLSSPRTARMRMELLSLRQSWQQLGCTLCLRESEIAAGPPTEAPSLEDALQALFAPFGTVPLGSAAPAGESDARTDDAILGLLARQHPELFRRLLDFSRQYGDFADEALLQAAGDLPFYLSWLDETDRLIRNGCSFCWPSLCPDWAGVRLEGCFDLALAQKLAEQSQRPVANGFYLEPEEHLVIITGPNQGGKTTFLRMMGQTFWLASLGLRVPGAAACLPRIDGICTHFLRLEDHGAVGLRTDLRRLKAITDRATDRTLVLINEIFSAVPRCDGLELGRRMLAMLDGIGCLSILVTFLTELAGYNSRTVSLKSLMADGEQRTYRLERQPPDGCAHALSLANQRGLTRTEILRRLQP